MSKPSCLKLLGACCLLAVSAHARDGWDAAKEPRLLIPLPSGCLIGAENGLFLLRSMDGTLERIGGEESVNDVQFFKDRAFVATDSGLFEYSPGNVATQWVFVPPYRRSVRQLYHYSDQEFFWATQDGMFYQYQNNARQIGTNTEIISIVGKLDQDVVSITENQVVLTSGEGGTLIECADKITSAVVIDGHLFVSTLSEVLLMKDGEMKSFRPNLTARDLQTLGPRILVATPRGLLSIDTHSADTSNDTTLQPGDFTDLHSFKEGFIALASDRICVFSSDAALMHQIPAAGARVCFRSRQFGTSTFFALDTGFLQCRHGAGGSTDWTFARVDSPVYDLHLDAADRILLATQKGLIRFQAENSPPLLMIGASLLGIACAGTVILRLRNKKQQPVAFISYRRSDARDATGRLRDHLIRELGTSNVRMDVHDINKGFDFRDEISRNLTECTLVIAVIGSQWASARDGQGALRLFSEVDYVRYELEKARELGKPIIPVLLGSTPPLQQAELPESIQYLPYLEFQRLKHDPDFEGDLRHLMKAITMLSKKSRGSGSTKTPQQHNSSTTPPR